MFIQQEDIMRNNILYLFLFCLFFLPNTAQALAAKEDAENLAILMAVMNYKIDDNEYLKDMESLRQDERFNRRLRKMLDKLSNNRTKNSTNKKVLDILEKAGKDLKRILD